MNRFFSSIIALFLFLSPLTAFRLTAQANTSATESSQELFQLELQDEVERDFYISEISQELFEKIKGKSYKADCPLPLSQLRHLTLLHKTLEGQTQRGELICNVKIAEPLLEIFKALYTAGYPIEKIRLIDEYDADDEKSMTDNNSSCFNFRFINHTTIPSMHGAGLAVDLNPLYNPYVKKNGNTLYTEPQNGAAYSDREADYPYKITRQDLAYKLFTEYGFEWGGDWKSPKDYQHFEWCKD